MPVKDCVNLMWFDLISDLRFRHKLVIEDVRLFQPESSEGDDSGVDHGRGAACTLLFRHRW